MKKTTLFLLMMTVVLGLNAQQAPMFFHNQTERLTYRMSHPDGWAPRQAVASRWANDYTQKLDSVVGSDNFDWNRWKNEYAFTDSTTVEIAYQWQNQAWIPTLMTETDLSSQQVYSYRWTDEGWELYYRVTYQYLACGDAQLVESMTAENLEDGVWVGVNRSTYEYDDDCNMVLNMNYRGMNEQGEWNENSKYECVYDGEGLLQRRLYSTIRNGNWRESQKDTLTYNDQHQCVRLLSQRKGNGFGPGGGNSWRNSYQYTFDYTDGQLASEVYYVAGWMGGDMTMDNKSEYAFDVNGNELSKTASVYNEVDWIVRDLYANTFDNTVAAASIQGLTETWENMVDQGMGYVLGMEMPLYDQWLTCSIVSSNLDTEFTLYCSGFASVDEQQVDGMKVYNQQGTLVVENAEPASIVVYDITGRRIAAAPQSLHGEFQLRSGLYVVGNGREFVKISIY